MLSTKGRTERLVRVRLSNKIEIWFTFLSLFCNRLPLSPLLLFVTFTWISATHRVLPRKLYHLSSKILLFGHGFELLKFMAKTNGTLLFVLFETGD